MSSEGAMACQLIRLRMWENFEEAPCVRRVQARSGPVPLGVLYKSWPTGGRTVGKNSEIGDFVNLL